MRVDGQGGKGIVPTDGPSSCVAVDGRRVRADATRALPGGDARRRSGRRGPHLRPLGGILVLGVFVGLTPASPGRLAAQAVVRVGEGPDRIELPAEDREIAVELEPVYRLGGLDGTGWQQFERVRELGFDGRGMLHVLDQGRASVFVVDPGGMLIRTLGGQGEGPGEFRSPYTMGIGWEGTVAVGDVGSRSLTIFDPAGEYVEDRRLDGSKGRISSFELDRAGRVVGVTAILFGGRRGEPGVTLMIQADGGEIQDPPGRPVLRAPIDGGEAERLAWAWVPPRESLGEVAFAPSLHWALLPDDRVAVVDSVDYRLQLLGGPASSTLTRPIEPRAVTRAEREAELDRRAADPSAGGGAGAGVGPTREEAARAAREARRASLESTMSFYREHQVIRGLRSDPGGRLWVQRIGAGPYEPGPIDVLTSGGRYLGTVPAGTMELPDAFGPGGLAVWLSEDSMDVPVITVRRVRVGVSERD